MSRSKWKGPLINLKENKLTKQNNFLKIVNKSSEIVPKFIGQTIKIHNGKSYSEIVIIKEMVGHNFGEFVFTRSKFIFKKKKSKK